MLRVTFLDHTAQLGGGEIALARFIHALGARIQPRALLLEDGPFADLLRNQGIPTAVLPVSDELLRRSKDARGLNAATMRQAASTVGRLVRHFRLSEVDVVHANSLKSGVLGSAAARLARVPCVWHVHDRISPDYLPAPTVRAVRAMTRRLPDAVVATSQSVRETLSRPGVSVIHPPLDARLFDVPEPPRRSTRFRIGLVGRLAPWKGQELFLEAFALAFREDPDVEAVLVGAAMFGDAESGYVADLQRLATDRQIADRVDFRGFRSDIGAEMLRLDLVVHASTIAEPWGQVIAEAMALGRPVVAVAAGGPTEMITHGVDGLLFRQNDADGLAREMTRLRQDPALAARLVAAGRESARRFEPSSAVGQLLAVYDAVRKDRR